MAQDDVIQGSQVGPDSANVCEQSIARAGSAVVIAATIVHHREIMALDEDREAGSNIHDMNSEFAECGLWVDGRGAYCCPTSTDISSTAVWKLNFVPLRSHSEERKRSAAT